MFMNFMFYHFRIMEKTLDELINICDIVISKLRVALNSYKSYVFLCREFSKELYPEKDFSICDSEELLKLVQEYFPLFTRENAIKYGNADKSDAIVWWGSNKENNYTIDYQGKIDFVRWLKYATISRHKLPELKELFLTNFKAKTIFNRRNYTDGLCILISRACFVNNQISKEDYYYFSNIIVFSNPKYNPNRKTWYSLFRKDNNHLGYFFKRGNKRRRLKWLNQLIKQYCS